MYRSEVSRSGYRTNGQKQWTKNQKKSKVGCFFAFQNKARTSKNGALFRIIRSSCHHCTRIFFFSLLHFHSRTFFPYWYFRLRLLPSALPHDNPPLCILLFILCILFHVPTLRSNCLTNNVSRDHRFSNSRSRISCVSQVVK